VIDARQVRARGASAHGRRACGDQRLAKLDFRCMGRNDNMLVRIDRHHWAAEQHLDAFLPALALIEKEQLVSCMRSAKQLLR
jgi:hypothetical protein